MAQDFQLAQINVARLMASLDSPQLAGFATRIAEINTLAEGSDGFVWRLKESSDPAPDPTLLVNISVWRDVDALFQYVYQSLHKDLFAQRKGWFSSYGKAHMALWWIAAGHQPSEAEAFAKLAHLQTHGETAQAFSFKQRYSPHGERTA